MDSALRGTVPSMLHEVLVDLFRESPQVLLDLLGDRLDTPDPSSLRFEPDEPNLSQLKEIDADLVLRVYDANGQLLCALIIEVQLSEKAAKARAWSAYQTGIHRRLGCPTFVIVIAIDPVVAAWAAGPFCTGQNIFRPLVLGPGQVPIVTSVDQARANLELTLLSGLAHHDEPETEKIGEALWRSLEHHQPDRGAFYWDLFLNAINEATKRSLKMRLENYRPQSEWGKRLYNDGRIAGHNDGCNEGRMAGEANALTLVLDARGLSMSPKHRMRIESCTDPDQLRSWVCRAATATSIGGVFDDS
jgi:hypothetical protein